MSAKQMVVVTGLAGAGKTTAARALEDLGFFVVDNLPPQLIETLIQLTDSSGGELRRIALVIDARDPSFLKDFGPHWDKLKAGGGHSLSLVFFDCSDDVLVRRFKETRRRHPLDAGSGVRAAIAAERGLLEDMVHRADEVIDTRDLSVHELKRQIEHRFGEAASLTTQQLTIMSFGFKHGLPPELDLCFDVRFLKNPYFVESLRRKTGLDGAVRDYVLEQPDARAFLEKVEDLLEFLLPRFQREGKAYVTLAVGCTGGRHRSVAIAEALAASFRREHASVRVAHRDADKAQTK